MQTMLESKRVSILSQEETEFLVGMARPFNGSAFRPHNLKIVCRCFTEEFDKPIGVVDATRLLMRALGKNGGSQNRHR